MLSLRSEIDQWLSPLCNVYGYLAAELVSN